MTTYNGPIKEVEVVEKIVISQEQAKAIECVKSDTYWNFEIFLNSHAKNKKSEDDLGESWNGEYYPLNKLSVGELAKAFYIGYEIEPEEPKLKRCDKVVRVDGDTFAGFSFIETVEEDVGYGRYRLENGFVYTEDFIKLATPEEIFWLEELGRSKVGDFRVGDVYVDENGIFTTIDLERHVSLAQEWHESGDFRGLFPAESFRPFKKEPE